MIQIIRLQPTKNMSTKILFINDQYLKEFSTLDINVDPKLIISTIAIAQDKYIHPLLGTALYNELKGQVDSGTTTTINLTLIKEYIKPCLAQYSLFESVDFLLFRFSNKSIEKLKSDTSEPINLKELEYIKNKFLANAGWYGERVVNYLCQNQTLYPLYTNPGSGFDVIRPSRTGYSGVSGIFLPKKGKYLGDTRPE